VRILWYAAVVNNENIMEWHCCEKTHEDEYIEIKNVKIISVLLQYILSPKLPLVCQLDIKACLLTCSSFAPLHI